MPPKKKKGKKKGRKKKDEGVLAIEDKYKKTLEEIEALKDHLAVRGELARRAQTQGAEWKDRMKEAEENLVTHQEDQRDVNADITRQYKTMQTEMSLRIHQLETELTRTQTQLNKTQEELKTVTDEKEKMCREKDREIADLQLKIDSMGMQYEGALSDAMDRLIEKIDVARHSWEDKSTFIQAENKQLLLEFGLNPLDI